MVGCKIMVLTAVALVFILMHMLDSRLKCNMPSVISSLVSLILSQFLFELAGFPHNPPYIYNACTNLILFHTGNLYQQSWKCIHKKRMGLYVRKSYHSSDTHLPDMFETLLKMKRTCFALLKKCLKKKKKKPLFHAFHPAPFSRH